MSTHINAKIGEIAQTVLLPGDPLRAKYIAENFLTDVNCYNQVRGMLGFTGNFKGKRISVQGTGMGVPSASIYITELLKDYSVKNLIRVGTCGSLSLDVKAKETLLIQAAATDSAVNKIRFGNIITYPSIADFDLLYRAVSASKDASKQIRVATAFSTDLFYGENSDEIHRVLSNYGVTVVDMETAELYTLSKKFGAHALSILTVSDEILTNIQTSSEERKKSFNEMIEIALNLV